MTLLFTEPQGLCFHSLWSAVSHSNYLQLPAESVGLLSSTNVLQKGGKKISQWLRKWPLAAIQIRSY